MSSNRFIAILTEGSIGRALLKMTVPMIWGMLAMMTFNLADTYFVAKLGTIPLAAMGFTFPVVLTIAHVALGLGIGASSVISRAIGEGDTNKVKRLTTDSLYLSLLLVSITILVGFLTINPLFKMMGANEQTLSYIQQYMRIWYIGVLFLVIPMVGNHAIRASGDAFIPGMIMVVGSLINIILDPILIFGFWGIPAMGIKGAAWATVVARALTMILSLWVLHKKKQMLSFQLPPLKMLVESWKKILYIGIPSSGTMLVPTICLGILTWMVADFGQEAVAGFGVAGKIEGFAVVIFMALSTVLSPFVGQNWGAHQFNRVRKGLTKVFNFSLIWGSLQAILLFIFAEPITTLFNHDPQVTRYTILYLQIIPISYGLLSIIHLSSAAFNALGKPLPAAVIMLFRLVILHIPLAYFGKKHFGFLGFLMATHIAIITTAILSVLWIRKTCKKAKLLYL